MRKVAVTPENKEKIINFVKTNPDMDDNMFHTFVKNLGVEPEDGEEVVYQEAYRLMNESSHKAAEEGVDVDPAFLNRIDDVVYFLQTAKTNLTGKDSSKRDAQQYLTRAKSVLDIVVEALVPKNLGS